MDKVLIKQGQLLTQKKPLVTDLHVADGRVYLGKKGKNYQPDKIIDARGCYVTTGLFDLQVNGSPQCNLWANPDINQFKSLCQTLLGAGVTAFLPTLITDDMKHLHKNIAFLTSTIKKTKGLWQLMVIPGIHLEGPFLSPQKPGVHPKEHVRPFKLAELQELAGPSIKLITLAPELEGAGQAIKYLRKKSITVSLGHTNANYEQADEAFKDGVSMVTHIFNAMPPMHQRQPGAAVAALLAKNVYCCVIADGLHVDPNMIRLLVQMKGVDKVILVTDMASVGTAGGELVGSSITLSDAVRNMVKWGIVTFPEAIQMATLNPAKAMKLQLGTIKSGGRADLVVWNKKTLAIKHVIAGGQLIF